jgi:hypothetical protein
MQNNFLDHLEKSNQLLGSSMSLGQGQASKKRNKAINKSYNNNDQFDYTDLNPKQYGNTTGGYGSMANR